MSHPPCDNFCESLSARRAWIEIPSMHIEPTKGSVALRKESVDRNDKMIRQAYFDKRMVALRKESVDRNTKIGV